MIHTNLALKFNDGFVCIKTLNPVGSSVGKRVSYKRFEHS